MKVERNEVMSLDLRVQLFATEVVLSLKLGRNEVFDYLLGGSNLGGSEVSPLASLGRHDRGRLFIEELV
jgi:hypothetical protein